MYHIQYSLRNSLDKLKRIQQFQITVWVKMAGLSSVTVVLPLDVTAPCDSFLPGFADVWKMLSKTFL